MATGPGKTISDIGKEMSGVWAKQQELVDREFLADIQNAPPSAIVTGRPSWSQGALNLHLEYNRRNKPASNIEPPEGIAAHQRQIFLSTGIAPSLGDLNHHLQQITSTQEKLDPTRPDDQAKADGATKLHSFCTVLSQLDKIKRDVSAHMGQYKKA